MLPPSDRSYSRRDTVLFLVCLALAITTLFTPARITTSISNGLRETVLYPLVWLQARAEEGRTSRARMRMLTAERDSAAYAAQVLPTLTFENERLRQLLKLSRRMRTPYVAAEVLHQAQVTDARMLLLSVGSGEGVATFDPVVAPEGLIGVVWSVGPNTSVAMTWAHPEFRVSAFTANGNASGIVAASPSATGSDAYLEFRGVPYRDSIPPGTLVLSSGLGGVYPKGIPIGTVVGIIREQAGWERVYRVRPAANPAATGHVLVLTSPRKPGVADAFPPDSLDMGPPIDSAAVAGSAAAARADSARRPAPPPARADSTRRAAPAPAAAHPDSARRVTQPTSAAGADSARAHRPRTSTADSAR
ncbi:MAG TPA: rod shape-determining protein MreC [Gemmatimonadales bacterium]|nr:rod shape-determining protein MreC [Gemmatimonadales bacterium]